MSIMSGSGKRARAPKPPRDPHSRSTCGQLAPGWVLARRWTQLASPAVVALVAWIVRRLS